MSGRRRAVLIAGPTASGKSALALQWAEREGGVIINTDAMQVYDTLRVLTARPAPDEMGQVPHLLYGTVPATTRFSTGRWIAAVRDSLARHNAAELLLFVGGTGLYFDALLHGLAPVPDVPAEVVLQVQEEVAPLDAAARLALLEREDPQAAARLGVADPQRLIRALAVKRATGKSLSAFQAETEPGLLADWDIERLVLDPERDLLRQRIALRFNGMIEAGALDEVQALRAQNIDPTLPATKAIGVPELSDYLDGVLSRDEAITRATIATQQYAKRQRTWFRNRFSDWPRR